jgi:hypothetical protein
VYCRWPGQSVRFAVRGWHGALAGLWHGVLALRMKPIIEARALAAMLEGKNQHSSPSEISHEASPIRTDEVVAGLANISSNLESLNLLVRHLTNKRHPFARMKLLRVLPISAATLSAKLSTLSKPQRLA